MSSQQSSTVETLKILPDAEPVTVLKHPLVQHKLTKMRRKDTPMHMFQSLCTEIATMLAYEVTQDLPLTTELIETPLMKSEQPVLQEKNVVIVPILRAGLGMVEGFTSILPNAKIGHIGMYRDHDTKKPVEYLKKLPSDISEREVIIVDPMLATGGSAIMAIDAIKKVTDRRVRLVCLLAAPEGLAHILEIHPDVEILCAAVDECLNDNAYILPGLGDAGDRLFGTL